MKKYLCAASLSFLLAMPSVAEWIYAGESSNPTDYPYAYKIHNGDIAPNGNQPVYGGDSEMCWAATAANLAAFWQQRYQQETGLSLPDGVPDNSTSSKRNSYIFDSFAQAFRNTGLGAREGLWWYFGGYSNSPYPVLLPGGYWAEYCSALGYSSNYDGLTQHSYVAEATFNAPTWNEYFQYDDPTDYATWTNARSFSDSVRTALEGGSLVALNLVNEWGSMGHVITLYGADFYEEGEMKGLVKTVLIQDNNNTNAPSEYSIKYDDTATVTLSEPKEGYEEKTFTYTKMWVDGLSASSRYITCVDYLTLEIPTASRVPEPSASILALLTCAALGLRRRRARA